jgi:alkylhydroperoxidase family enzyme
MPTLPPVPDAEAGEVARTAFDLLRSRVGAVPNIYRTLAHAPAVLDAVTAMGQAIRSGLAPKLRELAYLKTARLTDCHY